MKLSAIAIAYAHSVGFDTAKRVGTYKGFPLYVCDYNSSNNDLSAPCIGLPFYLIIKEGKAIELTADEIWQLLRN
jgi:hypothetical protein